MPDQSISERLSISGHSKIPIRTKRRKGQTRKIGWFDDTQEPIVDEETWLLAQKLRQNVRKADPMGEPNVLTGKIYCADCGAPMYNHRQRKGRERIYYTAKGEKGQVIPIRQIVMNVPHIILLIRSMTDIVLATIFQQKHLKASF